LEKEEIMFEYFKKPKKRVAYRDTLPPGEERDEYIRNEDLFFSVHRTWARGGSSIDSNLPVFLRIAEERAADAISQGFEHRRK
jgi:hypothetical protein